MAEPLMKPFGSWKSPITSDLIVSETVKFDQVAISGDDVYWTEMRPTEAGRYVLVRCSVDGQIDDVTPKAFNVRTRVHEYGGGAYLVNDGTVYFSNYRDQRLYCQPPGETPAPITPERNVRYADAMLDSLSGRLICVCEDHTTDEKEAANYLAAIELDGSGTMTVIASGHDFYAAPRMSPSGSQLAWLQWNHPNMPWDGTELCVAKRRSDGSLESTQLVAGGPDESIIQPEWSPDGTLYFLSDRTGWWNLYRAVDGQIEPLCPKEAEFGYPMWVFGMSSYGLDSTGSLLCVYADDGKEQLARLNTKTLDMQPIVTSFTSFKGLRVEGSCAAVLGGCPGEPSAVVRLDLRTHSVQVLKRSSTVAVEGGYLSPPQAITFPTDHDLSAHAYYYPPANQDYTGPSDDELPPLLVMSHGGPTGATTNNFNLTIQYWTSRGFAVLDVNYGGSTGYGREYRNRLRGQWGVVDVNDCVNGALHLVRQGLVDPQRLAIDGGSAGGFTTLCALAFSDVFQAGASYYGLSELTVFVGDTHKFESRYLDQLVGPYPEKKYLYEQRSALNHVDQISCPVIFLQGDEDKIVPPNQAELMVDALRDKGLPVAYLLFEGEQHGFRKSENIQQALDAEFYFYSRVFGFEPADNLEPVVIENLV